ncbi:MAG: hypothetical protein P1P88_21000 [Bacteroidales bacterium]|nr:hypothetical protein [Bacteroidales bacterium]
MLTINKEKVAEWMLLSYLAEQKYYEDKILFLERKHNANFVSFEEQINKSSSENFSNWDDYIDWKAYHNLYLNVSKMIEDVRLGNFKVA